MWGCSIETVLPFFAFVNTDIRHILGLYVCQSLYNKPEFFCKGMRFFICKDWNDSGVFESVIMFCLKQSFSSANLM